MSIEQYQGNLFESGDSCETIVIKERGLDLEYRPRFLDANLTASWFEQLLTQTSWKQDRVTVYGKEHLTPRLSCWMGDHWMRYTYAQNTMQPVTWQALPLLIKAHIEAALGDQFNSVLMNYYRDGQDSNGWHADNEPELGHAPTIASLSLGASRDFQLREIKNRANKYSITLEPGSLLVMRNGTQRYWHHQVPKRVSAGARINLTFRKIVKGSG